MLNWYVASSIVGSESKAVARLSRFETFLPVRKTPRYYLGELKDEVTRSMFPGYFFVYCEPELRPVKHCEYRGLLGYGGPGVGEPIPIADEAVEELRGRTNGNGILQFPDLTPGQPVEILQQGSYWGMRGLYECKSGDDAVIILLDATFNYRVPVLRSAVRLAEVR